MSGLIPQRYIPSGDTGIALACPATWAVPSMINATRVGVRRRRIGRVPVPRPCARRAQAVHPPRSPADELPDRSAGTSVAPAHAVPRSPTARLRSPAEAPAMSGSETFSGPRIDLYIAAASPAVGAFDVVATRSNPKQNGGSGAIAAD